MSNQRDEVDEIWAEDVLGRRENVHYLQRYLVDRYHSKKTERGFVLAVNAEWGYGKSFMLERWQKQIMFQGYPAVYFDAWQNDFTEDPLLAFIAEFDEGLKDYVKHVPLAEEVRSKTLDVVKKLWKPALLVLAGAATKHLAGVSLSQLKGVQQESGESGDDDGPSPEGADGKDCDLKDVQAQLKEAIQKALDGHKTMKSAIESFNSLFENSIKEK